MAGLAFLALVFVTGGAAFADTVEGGAPSPPGSQHVVHPTPPPGGDSAPPSSALAARVDGRPILVREVDAPSQSKIDTLRAELTRVATAALDDVIDEYLRRLDAPTASGPTPEPVSDDAVREFQRAHPEDFAASAGPEAAQRDPALTDAAVRHHLEAQSRGVAAAATRRRRWQGHAIEPDLPPASDLEEPLAAQRTVARIDSRPVPAADLERAAALRLYRLRGEIVRERSRNLTAAIDAMLLERAAARRGRTEAELLAVEAGPVTVTDEEIDAFIERERAAGRPAPGRERARPYLEFHKSHARRAALLDQLRARARIEILLREPQVPLLAPSDDDAPALGPAGGRRIVAFTNYRCRTCRAGHGELDRLRTLDPTLRVVFRDFIPAYDPVADEAARLARCGAALGHFDAVRRALLERPPPPFGTPWYTPQTLPDLARNTGLDPRAVTACLVAPATRAAIERDTAEAAYLGFDEAPAYVVEGIPLSGIQAADGLLRTLRDAETRRSRQAP